MMEDISSIDFNLTPRGYSVVTICWGRSLTTFATYKELAKLPIRAIQI